MPSHAAIIRFFGVLNATRQHASKSCLLFSQNTNFNRFVTSKYTDWAYPSPFSTCAASTRHSIIFLGTPLFCLPVFQALFAESLKPSSNFEVSAVITKRAHAQGIRCIGAYAEMHEMYPIEAEARRLGFTSDQILCPSSVKEASFLSKVAAIQPSLAVVAAYGAILPQAFLNIPQHGTINVHPSLLPEYRGAAPVVRAVMDGCEETGVSLAYTVLACDAGPVLCQERVRVDPNITAPELTVDLFQRGARMLLAELPALLDGSAVQRAVPQLEENASRAPRLSRDEAVLDFALPAHVLHNRVRAFAGWQAPRATLLVHDDVQGTSRALELKVLRTRACPSASSGSGSASPPEPPPGQAVFQDDTLHIPCGGGSHLYVEQLLAQTSRGVMDAKQLQASLSMKRHRLLVPSM